MYENKINPEVFLAMQEPAQIASRAIEDFARALAKATMPLIDAVRAFGELQETLQEYKKQKYLARYHRRGERMRKAGRK